MWFDQSLKPLEDQYQAIKNENFPASWLLQYDAIKDQELTNYIKESFSQDQELGIFLEVSPSLAYSSRVIYPHAVSWYDPQAVFLSGYSQSERKKLIDTVFSKFKSEFGSFPASVGTWWIDSYSLNYLKDKYKIKTILIVADQKTTDNYGVWGQWWGVAYYPSKANVLVPARSEKDKQDVVILQWAQRDLSKAYGKGSSFSNYSLQANDYTERKLDVSYFEKLAETYLNCNLPVGQITVGLETGIESVKSFSEYENQLRTLNKIENLKSITMSEFSNQFKKTYPSNPEKLTLEDDQSRWVLTPENRENTKLEDEIIYQSNLAFPDYFVADKSDFLDRVLPVSHQETTSTSSPILIFISFAFGFVIFKYFGLTRYYWAISFFVIASFLTTLMSFSKFGWNVYFGPIVKNISLTQFLAPVVSFSFFVPLLKFFQKKIKNTKLLALILPLTFGIDFLISTLRYIQLNGQHYFVIGWDALRFVGVKLFPRSIEFVNQDFPSVIANSFLKFDFNLIWQSKLVSLVLHPLAHIVLGVAIYFIISKLPKKLRWTAVTIMLVFFCLYIYKTVTLNPRLAL